MTQAKRHDDPYPSRQGPVPALLARVDPTVYCTPEQHGPLSAEQVAHYRQQGFLWLEDFITGAELAALQRELVALQGDAQLLQREEAITEPERGEMRSIFCIHQLNARFARLAADPRLADIARYLLADEVYIHQSRINFKPGFVGKEFAWHSDFETWHMEDGLPRMRTLSMSLMLTDNLPMNGALMLMPGSHAHYVSCVGETPDHHYRQSLQRQQVGVPDVDTLSQLATRHGVVMPSGKAGSLLIFDCNLMHGSNSNLSPYPRSNVFFVYNAVSNAPQAPFCGKLPRPAFVAARQPEPLRS